MKLSLRPSARAWLRRWPAVNPYSVLELLLLAVLAVQCARLLWAVVTPVGPLGDWRIASPGVGGSPATILANFDPFFRTSRNNAATTSVTSLQLKLFGTRIDDATGLSSAIIAGPDNVQNSVGVGEEVAPGVKLKAVAFDHVTLDRGGKLEELYIDQSGGAPAGAPGAAPAGDTIVSTNGAPPPGENGVTLAQMKADISFIPRVDGGRVTGLVVRPQGTGQAFRTVGFKEGDVVTAAGGRPIAGPADIDRVISTLAPGANLSITVERGAQTLPLAVTIKGQ